MSISTHTPLAGRDAAALRRSTTLHRHFYSHAPCGARRSPPQLLPASAVFLLTRPLRGATRTGEVLICVIQKFLLTRPLRGATATYSIRIYRTSYIQEADLKSITKYAIKLNMLHDSGIKSRRTSLDYTHHSTFACCFH